MEIGQNNSLSGLGRGTLKGAPYMDLKKKKISFFCFLKLYLYLMVSQTIKQTIITNLFSTKGEERDFKKNVLFNTKKLLFGGWGG